MDTFEDDEYEWQPPTEAEMKIIQARRERNNKISKLMGDYLLKGYKMLGISCAQCGTILLRDKQDKEYCVACSELDSDTDKDDPVVNEEAALSQVREHQRASLNDSSREIPRPDSPSCLPPSGSHDITAPASLSPPHAQLTFQTKPAASTNLYAREESARKSAVALDASDLLRVSSALQNKLLWAAGELDRTCSVESSIQLCTLVTAATKALQQISDLHTPSS